MSRPRTIIPILLVLALLLSTVLAACAGATPPRKGYEEAAIVARSQIWRDIGAGKIESATVAIMDQGKIVYSETFGVADREKGIPVDKNTMFNMGSIGKMFPTVGIMLLVDEGKVALDQPVTKYLSDFTMADPRYKDITVRMLLTHTSGIPGSNFNRSAGIAASEYVYKDTIDALSRAHLRHKPGESAAYTNDGFTLAEMIVARVSGQKFIDFLAERVFKPLGMKNSGLGVGTQTVKPIARYYEPGTTTKYPGEVFSVLGAGGLATTAEDLVRFGDSFTPGGKHILSDASLAEMLKPQKSPLAGKLKNPPIFDGLGWDESGIPQYMSRGIQVVGKGGDTMFYHSQLFIVPAQRLSVAMLKAGQGNPMDTVLDILDSVLVQKGLVPKKEKTVSKPPVPQSLPAEYADYGGYYGPAALTKVSFDLKGGTTTSSVVGQDGQEMPGAPASYHDGYFYGQSGTRAYFTKVDGRIYAVISLLGNNYDMISMQKLEKPEKPLSLRIDMNDRVWLQRNTWVSTYPKVAGIVKSGTVKDLPGYVRFEQLLLVTSPDSAGLIGGAVRDQIEIQLVNKGGATWVQAGDTLYSPADAAIQFNGGSRDVTIGKDGYSEWLLADVDLILSLNKPANTRVFVTQEDGTVTYDSALDTGETFASKGSYLQFIGNPGDTLKVTSK